MTATSAATVLSGVDALVRLLVVREQVDRAEGRTTATMVSGYPGSPLGTFDMAVERARETLAAHRVVHRPGLNEELAAAVVWGSQMGAGVEYADVDGVVGAWYGKAPGLDRSGDVLKHANALGAGPGGGAVLFCGDDPASKSSTLATDSRYTFQDACIPVVAPGDPQDVLDLGVHAYRMSRYSGSWVGMSIPTQVADGIGTVDPDPGRHHPRDPEGLVIDGQPWRHLPQRTIGPHAVPEQEALVVDRRLRAAQAYARHNGLDRIVGADPGARLGIVCAGKTYFDVVQAFADLGVGLDEIAGLGVRILRLGLVYPLVEDTLVAFAESVDELVVVEEKRAFVETQVRTALHEAGSAVPVRGKRDRTGTPQIPSGGELDPVAVAALLVRLLPGLKPPGKAAPRMLPLLDLPGRSPGYCSGCPHNRSTVVPDGALVGGGVGCHGIMYFEPRNAGMRSLPPTPMGAEGVPWIGLSPFVADPHLIQNLGDGTLSHSGTLAIRASVAAGADITFKILYNAAVAMTGGQEVTGLMDVPALTRALEAEGVAHVVVCAEDPKRYGRRARWARGVEVRGRDDLPEVQERLRAVPGVTVIIYDQQCAAEARRLRKRGLAPEPPRRVVINEGVCEGCGDCAAKSNCLSVLPVATEFGEKRAVHDPSCNRDYTCLEGDCPSFVTITPARRGRRRAAARAESRPVLPRGTLPEPELPAIDGRYGVYFTGIGGTGVVTANRIVAAAAEAAGLVLGGLDQTGLSQKAGAVVSHLQLARTRDGLGSAAVSDGGADLYLSGDILQAAAASHLARTTPGRTLAVLDTHLTPTAGMLQGGVAQPADASLEGAVTERVGADRVVLLDARGIAEAVFANHLLANVVLLGAAFQRGGLPIPLAELERAAGARGADNREAFEWGRWAVHDPAGVAAVLRAAGTGAEAQGSITDPTPAAVATAVGLVGARELPGQLRDLLIRRTAQVVDYQDARRATRFLDLVALAAARDDAAHDWDLTRAVAESWFKVLTYKDEYEVARLHLRADYDRIARDLGIEGPYAVRFHLHPPTLRRLGMRRKLVLGRPYELAFQVLRRMKRLRGTPFDLFGLDPDRRTERAVVREYEGLLADALPPASGWSHAGLVELAESPLSIKGYAAIKEEAVAAWREETARLRTASAAPAVLR